MPIAASTNMMDFVNKSRVTVYKENEIILFQGEVPREAYVIKKGVVKTYNLTESGEEQLIELVTKGDVISLPWVLGKLPSSLYYYEALTNTELYCLPREAYVQYLKSDPKALYEEFERITLRSMGGMLRLNALMQPKATHKILSTLHFLSQTHGRSIGNDNIEIDIALTHQDIANLTGLTRETTATEINKLKRSGVISYKRRTIYIVNLPKLKLMLNDQFIADSQINFHEFEPLAVH